MLSPGRLSPLNSSTTAVSSSSSSSSSSLSSPSLSSQPSSVSSAFTAKFKTRNNNSSSSSSSPSSASFSSSSSSRFKSSSCSSSSSTSSLSSSSSLLFFVATLLRLLLFLAIMSAGFTAPVTFGTARSRSADNGSSRFVNVSIWDANSTLQPSDMPQADEPPRNMEADGVPNHWSKQPQERYFYLRAQNDQYLQIFNNTITGTKAAWPVYGIFQFLSHNFSVVIKSFLGNTMLCMNEKSRLYLRSNFNSECLIKEGSLHLNGSLMKTYEFEKYSNKTHKRYLGINCDPVMGVHTSTDQESSRFIDLPVSDKTLEEAKNPKNGDDESARVGEKCVYTSERDKKKAEKARRQKLRSRWCWNLDRMTRDADSRSTYMQKCIKKHKKQCDKAKNSKSGEGECVCDILENMLNRTKRAKRKCLVEKVNRWVKRMKQTPNRAAILEAVKELVPLYPQIATRLRRLRRTRGKGKLMESPAMQAGHHQKRRRNRGRSRVQSHPVRHTHRRCRIKSVNLTKLLKTYGHELYINSTSPGVPQITASDPKAQYHLSEKFKERVKELIDDHAKRRKNCRRRQRRKRRRHSGMAKRGIPHKNKQEAPG